MDALEQLRDRLEAAEAERDRQYRAAQDLAGRVAAGLAALDPGPRP